MSPASPTRSSRCTPATRSASISACWRGCASRAWTRWTRRCMRCARLSATMPCAAHSGSPRRTLWVATPATTRRMHAAATLRVAAAERRRTVGFLGVGGVPEPEEWLTRAKRQVVELLRGDGPMTTREIGRRLPELTVPLGVSDPSGRSLPAHPRVLSGLGFDGVLVRTRPTGTWINGQYTWAVMDDWLPGGVGGLPERGARRDLTEHYLQRFGPATSTDLQWWAGWSKTATTRALADAAAQEVETDDGPAWVAADDAGTSLEPDPWVALLPGLDPTVMGWKERSFYLPAKAAPAWDRNGNAGPTIWVDGQVVGAWGQARDGSIRTHFFVDVPAARRAQVAQRAVKLRAILGPVRYAVRFPGAINAELLR
ncbi:MAG: winged helix DNA-binding domain-containing protein [Ornithinimicrobium sp.]|uniref:winged helix DNA-binding domain-containing protein n=1 Tax=Ornithinimicrobium sp. TaxID=1977084 RepID=UPI003D9AE260